MSRMDGWHKDPTLIMVAMAVLILAVTPDLDLTFGQGPNVRRPDPVLDIMDGTDCPVYRSNDHWNYSTTFYVNVMGLSVPFSGWLNMSVVQVALDPFLGMAPVYIMNLTGNISGHMAIPFLPDMDIYLDLEGYTWTKVQDLSVYRSVLNASVSGSIPSLNGYYPFGYEFSPPLEEYDFPLLKGDSWWTNVTARLPFGASGELLWMNSTWSLGPEETMTVPAGSFKVLPVSKDGNKALFYNSTVGNTVKRYYELDLAGTKLNVPLELKAYKRHPSEKGLALRVSSPQPVLAGGTFKVEGVATVSNTAVTILFPDGKAAAFIPLLLGDRSFEATLKAPKHPDDTLTHVDHGSFGVLAILGPLDAMAVATVTTWATDAALENGSLMVTHTGGGTIDDTFTAHIRVRNPSNYKVEGLQVLLIMDGPPLELLNMTEVSIPAGEQLEVPVEVHVASPGSYNLTLLVDPKGTVPEMDEDNNMASTSFIVKERTRLEWVVDPTPGDLLLPEGGGISFYASAIRGSETIPGKWTLDGAEVGSNGPSFNFTAAFVGDRSSRAVPYALAFSLDQEKLFEGEPGSVRWNITVTNVDRPPVVSFAEPSASLVWTAEGEPQLFSVEAFDPDGDSLVFVWSLNGDVMSVHGPAFVLVPSYTGPNSSEGSPFLLEVNITDDKGPKGFTSMVWTVNVNDTDRPFLFSFDPPPGNISVHHDEGIVLSYNASDLDGTPVISVWLYNGLSLNGSNALFFKPAELGLSGGETVQVRLWLTSGSHSASAAWNISIIRRPPPPPVRPPQGVMIVSPREGEVFLKGEDVTLKAVASDKRELWYIWEVNGEPHKGREVVLEGLGIGLYTAVLQAYPADDTFNRVTLYVNFTVAIDDKGPPPDGVRRGPSPYWLLLLIPIAAALVTLTATMVLRKRGDEITWEE